MASQSRHPMPAFLLTRPAEQGVRFGRALQERFGEGIRLVTSPLLVPEFLSPELAQRPDALIFTSETAVAAYQRISADPALRGVERAWCVGDRTAHAASAAGLQARSANGDAAALVAAIAAAGEHGPLLHLRGVETRGDVANQLAGMDISAFEAVVYDQEARPLTAEALDLLREGHPVIAPLFSPRTARLLTGQIMQHAPDAILWLALLSPAVAEAAAGLQPKRAATAAHPDADSLIGAIEALIAAEPHA